MSEQFITISDLRKLTGAPDHRINYALKRHGPEPRGRIGMTRVWGADDVRAVQLSLSQTQRGRKGAKS